MHVGCRSPEDVSLPGSIAIYNLANSNSANSAKLVAAGAREVLQAIVANPASSADAVKYAKKALSI